MDKHSIIAQLELDIQALQQQVAEFKHPENISNDEWDLFAKRLDLMHAYCNKLKHESQAERKPEVTAQPAPIQERKEEVKTNVEPVIMKEETITAQQVETRSYQDSRNTVELKASQKKQTVSVGGLFGDMLSVADQFKDEPSVAESLAKSKSDKSVADKMNRTPIKDLKDAIGINEKFILINELFDGNRQNYDEAIHKLNTAANLEAAQEYIATLATRFNWTINDHVKNLSDLVARKFMS